MKDDPSGRLRIANPPLQYVQHEYHSVKGKNPKKHTVRRSQKKVSAFILKLFNMLHDPNLSNLIWWSRLDQDDVTTFALVPGSQFSQCLAVYFKHSNVASFVRQLHMYGFHKVSDLPLNGAGNDHSIWEFRHSLGQFKRGDTQLLQRIKRRNNNKKHRNDSVEVDISGKQQPIKEDQHQPSHSVYQQYQLPQQQQQQQHTIYSPQPQMMRQSIPMNYPQGFYSPSAMGGSFPHVPTSLPIQKQPPPVVRTHSPQNVSPMFADNVFFNHPHHRNRYPSVLVDPCAAPTSNNIQLDESQIQYPSSLVDSNRSRSAPLLHQPQQQQQPHQIIMSQRIQNEHRYLPLLQTVSTSSLPPITPDALQQFRPSIFAMHQQQQQQQQYQQINNYNNKSFNGSIASTVTRDSIFSTKLSIASSNGGSISLPIINRQSSNPIENLLNSETSSKSTSVKINEVKDDDDDDEADSAKIIEQNKGNSPSDIALKQ